MNIDKTNECLWCGFSEAQGAQLKQKCASINGRLKFECVDRKKCDERIHIRILVGRHEF